MRSGGPAGRPKIFSTKENSTKKGNKLTIFKIVPQRSPGWGPPTQQTCASSNWVFPSSRIQPEGSEAWPGLAEFTIDIPQEFSPYWDSDMVVPTLAARAPLQNFKPINNIKGKRSFPTKRWVSPIQGRNYASIFAGAGPE